MAWAYEVVQSYPNSTLLLAMGTAATRWGAKRKARRTPGSRIAHGSWGAAILPPPVVRLRRTQFR